MMASAAAAVEAVRRQRDDALTRGFEGELRRELQRSGAATADPRLPSGPYTFQRFEVWQRPGLSPPPAEALKLLHRCGAYHVRRWAGRAGVCCCRWHKHRWNSVASIAAGASAVGLAIVSLPLLPAAVHDALTRRLAADPGIVGVMSQHKWTVGLLRCARASALPGSLARIRRLVRGQQP